MICITVVVSSERCWWPFSCCRVSFIMPFLVPPEWRWSSTIVEERRVVFDLNDMTTAKNATLGQTSDQLDPPDGNFVVQVGYTVTSSLFFLDFTTKAQSRHLFLSTCLPGFSKIQNTIGGEEMHRNSDSSQFGAGVQWLFAERDCFAFWV